MNASFRDTTSTYEYTDPGLVSFFVAQVVFQRASPETEHVPCTLVSNPQRLHFDATMGLTDAFSVLKSA